MPQEMLPQLKEKYKALKKISVRNIMPPNPEDSLIRVTCPSDDLRNKINMKQALVFEKEKCIAFCKESFDNDIILSLACVLKNVVNMHILLDFDIIDKKDPPPFDPKDEFNNIVEILNKVECLKNLEWEYSTRSGGGGMHIYAKNAKISKDGYSNLIKHINDGNLFGIFSLDCPANLTLPYCGKNPDKSFVYMNLNNEPDPTPWCNCENCIEVIAPEPKGKKRSADEMMDCCLEDLINKHTFNVDDYVEWETECTQNNAMLYVNQKFDKPEDENNQYYRAAKNIKENLYHHSEEDIKFALLAEKSVCESVDLFKLYRGRAYSFNSRAFETIIANKTSHIPKMYMFFFQYPTYEFNKDEIYIYTKNGWIKENKSFLGYAIDMTKRYLAISNNEQEWSTARMAKAVVNFWNFTTEIDDIRKNNKMNNLILTKDDYFFCAKEKVFVKNCILYPLSLSKSLYFYKDDICLFKCNKFVNVIKNIANVKTGDESLIDLLKRFDLECNDSILMCLYFLMTFFNFESQTILEFISLMFNIFCGKTKHIIYVIGESADNGKTTLLRLIHSAFGNDFSMFNIKELEYKKISGSTASPDFFKSSGKKIVCADECGNVVLDVNLIKTLTSGGTASSRTLYQETKEISCNTNLILFGNSKPILNEQDNGILNRLYVFDVGVQFSQRGNRLWSDLLKDKNIDWTGIVDLDINAMGLGFLSMLMSFDVHLAETYSAELKKKQVPFGTVDHYAATELVFNQAFSESEVALIESVKAYCNENNVHPDKLVMKVKSKFNKNFDGYAYNGFKVKSSNSFEMNHDLLNKLS